MRLSSIICPFEALTEPIIFNNFSAWQAVGTRNSYNSQTNQVIPYTCPSMSHACYTRDTCKLLPTPSGAFCLFNRPISIYKIHPNTINLSTRLWWINTTDTVFISHSLVPRTLVLGRKLVFSISHLLMQFHPFPLTLQWGLTSTSIVKYNFE